MDNSSALNKHAEKTQDGALSTRGATTALPVDYAEHFAAFASGLPAWSIEPPAIVVRRKARV